MNESTHGARHDGMDWLRIGAFLLLISYHVGLAFGPWDYELKSDKTADWFAYPLLALNAWRLSLLFAISGFASAALFDKLGGAPGRFTRERLARLAIPVVAGMALWVVPQPWVALVTQHDYPHGFWYFVTHDYYAFQEIDGLAMPSWMHLWFVVYLLAYTLVMGLALLAPVRVREGVRAGAERVLAGWLLLPLPIAYFFFARLLPNGWNDSHDLVGDPAAHLVYFACFLFGWLLRRSDALRAAIARQWKLAALVGLAGMAGVLSAEFNYPGDTPLPDSWRTPFLIARACQMWGTIAALFGVADAFWNRDHPWRATLSGAVFPLYIAHQTVILLAGYLMLQFDWPMAVQWFDLMVATAIGSWLFYAVGRRLTPLRPLIGLRLRPRHQ